MTAINTFYIRDEVIYTVDARSEEEALEIFLDQTNPHVVGIVARDIRQITDNPPEPEDD